MFHPWKNHAVLSTTFRRSWPWEINQQVKCSGLMLECHRTTIMFTLSLLTPCQWLQTYIWHWQYVGIWSITIVIGRIPIPKTDRLSPRPLLNIVYFGIAAMPHVCDENDFCSTTMKVNMLVADDRMPIGTEASARYDGEGRSVHEYTDIHTWSVIAITFRRYKALQIVELVNTPREFAPCFSFNTLKPRQNGHHFRQNI